MKTRFRFEKLEVWQEARKINQVIYRLTRKFPREELFAMTSQIRRAFISVSSKHCGRLRPEFRQGLCSFP